MMIFIDDADHSWMSIILAEFAPIKPNG